MHWTHTVRPCWQERKSAEYTGPVSTLPGTQVQGNSVLGEGLLWWMQPPLSNFPCGVELEQELEGPRSAEREVGGGIPYRGTEKAGA